MDPFDGIPTEIRLEILINCDRLSMVALSHASPIMLRVRQIHKVRLARKFIDKALLGDKRLTQFAVAIVLCPGPATAGYIKGFRERLYQPILRNKCPRFHDDPDLTLKIDALCQKAHHFMMCQIDEHCRRFRGGTTEAIDPQANRPTWEDIWIEKRQLEQSPQVPVPYHLGLSADQARKLTRDGTPNFHSLAIDDHIIIFSQFLKHEVEQKRRQFASGWGSLIREDLRRCQVVELFYRRFIENSRYGTSMEPLHYLLLSRVDVS
ncbi:hypothetical protein V8F33_007562 [Rhypophila sp. PSN 637]